MNGSSRVPITSSYEPVVVTGLSMICALGNDRETVWQAVREGACGLGLIEGLDISDLYFSCGGEAKTFRPGTLFDRRQRRLMDRSSQMAVQATGAALEHAGAHLETYDPFRVGISLGTSLGGLEKGEAFHRELLEKGFRRTRPRNLIHYPLYTPADNVGIHFKVKGPKWIVSNACAAGANAIGLAADVLQAGKADLMVAGGVDPLDILSLAGFNSLQAVDPEPCAPYSRSGGMNVSEGAAILILEPEKLARERGAQILAYIPGYALSSDAYHATAPDVAGTGAVRSMKKALSKSGLSTEDVDYVSGHGTGTPANDRSETLAVTTVFGDKSGSTPLSSLKSQTGHSLGAAGALEAAICVQALNDQIVPPTVNFEDNVDEDIAKPGFDFVPNKAKEATVNAVISNSFAFGGNNCSVVFSKARGHFQKPELSRALITGVGVVSPLGSGKQRYLDALRSGEQAVAPVRSFNTDQCRGKLAAEITDRAHLRYVDPKYLRKVDQLGRMSLAASRMAILDASLKMRPSESERVGLVFATGTGPLETIEAVHKTIVVQGAGKVNPKLFPNTVMNAAAGYICMSMQIKGPTSTLATGSVAGLSAVSYAREMLRRGDADVVLVVSADEFTPTYHLGSDRMGLLTAGEEVKPYDEDRSGMALSAGGVAMVLESEERARGRGVTPIGEVLGSAITSDAYKLAGNEPTGEAWGKCFRMSVEEAALEPHEVRCVYGDARGMQDLDRAEARAVASSFPASSTRLTNIGGQLGYAQSTAAMFSLVAALETCRTGWVPEIAGLDDPLSEVKAYVGSTGESEKGAPCVISSANWGGTYASVVVGGGSA